MGRSRFKHCGQRHPHFHALGGVRSRAARTQESVGVKEGGLTPTVFLRSTEKTRPPHAGRFNEHELVLCYGVFLQLLMLPILIDAYWSPQTDVQQVLCFGNLIRIYLSFFACCLST